MNATLYEIFKIFFIIGIQLLGGGYVIVPLLQKYIVEDRKWLTGEELIDYYAMSQCIPGIIAGNIAILSGYKARKIPGAIAAITGIVMPSFFSILLLAHVLMNIVDYPVIQNAFWGIRISVIILILITIKDMWKKSVNSKFTYFVFFFILVSLFILPVSPAIIIVFSAILALIHSKITGEKTNG